MGRIERAVSAVGLAELDALLVSDLVNVRWLSGYAGTNALVVLGATRRVFLTDFRYLDRARREQGGVLDVREGGRSLLGSVAGALPEHGDVRLGYDERHLTVAAFDELRAALPERVQLLPAAGLIERLRAVKEPEEVDRMRAAAEAADAVAAEVLGRGVVGRPEREVAAELETEALRRFGLRASFPPMVASGPRSDAPHSEPTEQPIPPGTLLMVDFGLVLDGYCSDGTRTYATAGPLGEEEQAVHALVRSAQAEALAAVRPGADPAAIDAIARDRIAAAGHGERFGHGLGHGVGLLVQEEPRLTRAATGALEAGNVVTVEPGVYLPGRFGVRIEDLVAVTSNGHELLGGRPKELVTLD